MLDQIYSCRALPDYEFNTVRRLDMIFAPI